ncbi:MAG TPA: DUF2182 domain-containing protein [Gaiellaceae bacterium]|jgi:predicted metal-binding membrane protein|nr:DUF2182 domain-containing protein [Gaiellaceae bacterium]
MVDVTVLRPRRVTRLAVVVIAVALVCWVVAADRMRGMDMGPGTGLGSLPFFLGIWVTMMAAMMLPSALPMVQLFDRIGRDRRGEGRAAPRTAVFVASYLAVWAAYGLVAFAVYRGIAAAHWRFIAWDRHGPLVAGAAVAGAGLYELTRLKRACLRHCRGPMHFILGGWRPGNGGAFLMGVEHGGYCVGCCFGLMLILFALGAMSLTWMAVVTIVIFAQKVLPRAAGLHVPLAVALVGLGIWIAVAPDTVPGLTVPMATMG